MTPLKSTAVFSQAMTGGLALAALRRFRPSRGYRLAGANPNAQRPLGLHRAAAVLAKPKETTLGLCVVCVCVFVIVCIMPHL